MKREEADRPLDWVDHVDRLNFTLERVKALSHAMFAVVFTQGAFWKTQNMPVEVTLPLSELAKDLCDKADAHVDALYHHFRELNGHEELEQILEERKRLDPEGRELLDEVAAFLHTATPEMKEAFSQRIKIIEKNMKKEG